MFSCTGTHTPKLQSYKCNGNKVSQWLFHFPLFPSFFNSSFISPSLGDVSLRRKRLIEAGLAPAVRDFEDTAGGLSQTKHLTFTSLIGHREKMKIEHPSILYPQGNWNCPASENISRICFHTGCRDAIGFLQRAFSLIWMWREQSQSFSLFL